ncbi:TonB-linked SusC/RagA family outer membrane protein [Pedobacter africanus]|uniref:TonB-linked SusC/RagA family outer membrane protein n=1 Tax=Pedobacter africanus TaxID=151894 RepID=A0ACC6KVB7_9SPHI|nr:SusC/RagA family TonB-linked outer membrane protein [Pedobacter africanus]MDR6783313.1 TonB-linked SusC/RagA family outer membrane protein [Pedobacter africanus]
MQKTIKLIVLAALCLNFTALAQHPQAKQPHNKQDTTTKVLNEVTINAGYYTVKQRELTGNITKITAKTIEKQPINNPLQALQNRVAGLEITQLTGVPGGGYKVQIRGRNSISSGNAPLYLVDGVTYPSSRINTANSSILGDASPLSLVNPADIESIEVLKDADATAIYGSRGANGVILITTKKGALGEIRIEGSTSYGFAQLGHKLQLMNTRQYLAMRTEALKNSGLSPSAADMDLTAWDQDKYTDWQDLLIGGTANISNSAVKISGGTTKSSYLLGANYYTEGTVFPGSFGFKRGGAHSNINFGGAKSPFKASFTASYTYSSNNLPSIEPTTNIVRTPNAPDVYDQYGNLHWYHNNLAIGSNPIANLLNTTVSKGDNLLANADLSYRILKGLILKASIGYTTLKREELSKLPNAARNPATNPNPANRQSQFGNISNSSYVAEPQLTYEHKIGAGKLNALAGLSFQESTAQYRNIFAANFSSDELMENISSASVFSINENSYTKYKYTAVFARLNYSLKARYYFNLTGRRDGSSRFGPGRQFANFGAVGAAWIFSDEELIRRHLPFLSFGKLRASYGITGNDQIADYQYMQLYSGSSSYQGSPSIYINRIANPDFAWETNIKAEAALQLGFLQDRINMQLAYFRNRSSNQLLGTPLPPSVGAASIIANLPATVQNTGLEFETSVGLISSKKWNWQTSFNFTLPKNKLLSYPDLANSGNATSYIIGQPLDIRRYYNTYVDPQTGVYVAEDIDGNGLRNDADRYLYKFMGQVFYGGWQNTVQYKSFSLDFLISFVKQNGNSLLSGIGLSPGFFLAASPVSNQPVALLNRWQNPGDATDIPKFSGNIAGFTNFGIGSKEGSQSVSDNSFARLKNVSLSYQFSKQWLNRLKIKYLDLNLQGQNLLTLTGFKGLDPENPGSLASKLPPLQTLTIGLKLIL